jgi:hypothetical protein
MCFSKTSGFCGVKVPRFARNDDDPLPIRAKAEAIHFGF